MRKGIIMGYRSEVKSIIYSNEKEIEAFKLAHFELYNQICEEYGSEVTTFNKDGRSFIYLNADYTKWYDEYDEVQHWNSLLDLAQCDGLNTEFVRIGESSEGDIEQDYYGDNNLNYLSPRITIDVGFDYGN
jgi:hypothetical protein